MPLEEGKTVQIVGTKEEYNGIEEVIASSLKIID